MNGGEISEMKEGKAPSDETQLCVLVAFILCLGKGEEVEMRCDSSGQAGNPLNHSIYLFRV